MGSNLLFHNLQLKNRREDRLPPKPLTFFIMLEDGGPAIEVKDLRRWQRDYNSSYHGPESSKHIIEQLQKTGTCQTGRALYFKKQ